MSSYSKYSSTGTCISSNGVTWHNKKFQKAMEEYAKYLNRFERAFLYGTPTRNRLKPCLNDKIRIL
jgi:hypothetical protein